MILGCLITIIVFIFVLIIFIFTGTAITFSLMARILIPLLLIWLGIKIIKSFC
ncbi:hypothetical protein EDD65_101251 [Keratinibaculum paraultunense]|uniref:Uncharacterized protein n=1 Tax=Keratinibaculum paraultunense TaxID=1278232 RepID=A0A4R3KZH8_9FIRM|nr:hypothetical protein [Keratinibaculum paraultunense]QQY79935.1 hypothetical protein JL105_00955 [Keratinibaculum paraultunense]TCS91746.1 hypothetical protein EDD65_101251 [Keratinibaculum paraultunense]